MNETFALEGITCSNCLQTVKQVIDEAPGIKLLHISQDPSEVRLELPTIDALATLNKALREKGDYRIVAAEQPTQLGKVTTYRPLILILLFLLTTLALEQWHLGGFHLPTAMRHFMGGFFLIFSFFKILDVRGFANAYRGYDLVAARFKEYGFIYPFLELLLGIYFLSPLSHIAVLWFTLALMIVSTLGVVNSLVKQQKIACACLGTVFKLPMSTVTLVEDLLMIIMSVGMLSFY